MTKNTQKKEPALAAEATPTRSSARTAGRGLLLMSLVGSLTALAVSGYVYLIAQQQQSVINQALDNTAMIYKTMQQLVKKTEQSSAQTAPELNKEVTAIKEQQARLESDIASLNKGMAKAMQSQDQSSDSWALHEAEYLIQLAQYNLYFYQSPKLASNLLVTAKQRLEGLGDPKYQPLRQQLTDSILSLESIAKNNQEQWLMMINSLIRLANDFPFAPLTHQAPKPATMEKPASKSQWQMAWDASMHKLSKLVVIRQRDNALTTTLHPENRLLVKQNFQLILQQMQWAILQKQQPLLIKSIQQAQLLIEQYADPEHSVTQQMLAQLEQLATITVSPELPNINHLVTAIAESMKPNRASSDDQPRGSQ